MYLLLATARGRLPPPPLAVPTKTTTLPKWAEPSSAARLSAPTVPGASAVHDIVETSAPCSFSASPSSLTRRSVESAVLTTSHGPTDDLLGLGQFLPVPLDGEQPLVEGLAAARRRRRIATHAQALDGQ